MSLHIDKKFINMVSPQLERFAWKKDNLANCRCPICGDSQTNKSKARGFFYARQNNYFYKCHNCDYGSNIYNFLKEISPSLCKEYSLETFSGRKEKTTKVIIPKKTIVKYQRSKKTDKLKDLKKISELEVDHPCVEFLVNRRIPKDKWNMLYYTDDFGSFMKTIDDEYETSGYKDSRLVIPFFDQNGDVVAAQGRMLSLSADLNAKSTAKYLTVKTNKESDRLWYGQWRVDPKKTVYIVEGPLDSLFIPNCIAMVGAGAIDSIPEHLKDSNGVYVLDNEPRNKQIVSINERLIELGKRVCIWPHNVHEKDINDMIYKRKTTEIVNIIDENTFEGLEALVRLRKWSKS